MRCHVHFIRNQGPEMYLEFPCAFFQINFLFHWNLCQGNAVSGISHGNIGAIFLVLWNEETKEITKRRNII